MKKWKETSKKFDAIQTELRADCEQYIIDCIKQKYGVKELNNTTQYYLHIIEDEYNERPMIVYDGGLHSEYDGKLDNEVYGVGLDDKGRVYIDTEECENYSINRADTYDLVLICYALEYTMISEKKPQISPQ